MVCAGGSTNLLTPRRALCGRVEEGATGGRRGAPRISRTNCGIDDQLQGPHLARVGPGGEEALAVGRDVVAVRVRAVPRQRGILEQHGGRADRQAGGRGGHRDGHHARAGRGRRARVRRGAIGACRRRRSTPATCEPGRRTAGCRPRGVPTPWSCRPRTSHRARTPATPRCRHRPETARHVWRSSRVSETMSSPWLSCTDNSAIRPSGEIAGMSPATLDSGVSRTRPCRRRSPPPRRSRARRPTSRRSARRPASRPA